MTLLEDRRSYPTAGGTVVYAPDSLGRSYRAIRTDGVPLGRFATFEDADAVLRDQLAPDAPRPPPVARCRHCRRTTHQSDDCPEQRAARERIERKRSGHETVGTIRVAQVGDRLGGGRRVPDAVPRIAAAQVDEETRTTGEGEEGTPMTSRTDAIPDLTADPHTLDEYAEALVFAAKQRPCTKGEVRRMVWGASGSHGAVEMGYTELALDELVAQGRADRDLAGRYKPRAAGGPPVAAEGSGDGAGGHQEAAADTEPPGSLLDGLACPGCGAHSIDPCAPGCTALVEPEEGEDDDPPYVCPGCHAVGEERCAPGCIDAEIEEERRQAIESGDYDDTDDPDADVEATEGDGVEAADDPAGITLGDVVRAADAAGFTVDFSFPKKPRTIDDLAAKYTDGPIAEVRRARDLVSGLPAQRERLERAVTMLSEAVAEGHDLLADLDLMIGGGR